MSFPDVSEVLPDFSSTVTFRLTRKTVKDGIMSEEPIVERSFRGVIEPIPARKLVLRPEGQRAWRWWTLWTIQVLDPDSLIVDDEGTSYRVMNAADYRRNGNYHEYELAQGVPND